MATFVEKTPWAQVIGPPLGQPVNTAVLNRLIMAFRPMDGTIIDVVSDVTPTTIGGTPDSTAKYFGASVHLDGSAEDFQFNDSPSLRLPTTGITIIWIGEVGTGSGNDWPRFFGKTVNNGSDPFISYDLTAQDGPDPNALFGLSTGSGGSYTATAATTNLPKNVPLLICGRWGDEVGDAMTLDVFRLDTLTRHDTQKTATFAGPIGYDAGTVHIGSHMTNPGIYMEQQFAGLYVLDYGIGETTLEAFLSSPWHPFYSNKYLTVAAGGPPAPSIPILRYRMEN